MGGARRRRQGRSLRYVAALTLAVAVSAIPSSAADAKRRPKTTKPPATTTTCPAAKPTSAPEGPSEKSIVVQRPGDGLEIAMAKYPRPDGLGRPWSQWGQGVVLSDGRFVSAMGNHLGIDGNAFVFVYDPRTATLTRIGDVLSALDHQAGEWGYGKIHAQMARGACDEVYLATYWGTRTKLTYSQRYQGDLLMRLNPRTLELKPLGVPVPEHGIPSLMAGTNGLLYGEATDPLPDGKPDHDVGAFFVYDPAKQAVVFRADDPTHTLFRSLMIGADGRVYMAEEDGHLLVYEGGDKLQRTDYVLPGGGGLRGEHGSRT